jgi:hypothetical protein
MEPSDAIFYRLAFGTPDARRRQEPRAHPDIPHLADVTGGMVSNSGFEPHPRRHRLSEMV